MKSEQSKLANTGGLAPRVDSNLRNVSSPTLGIVLKNGLDVANEFTSHAGVGAQVPGASGQSGASAGALAKMSPADRQQALQGLRAQLAAYKKIRAEGSSGLYGMTTATLEVNIRNVEDAIRQLEAK